MSAVTVVTMLSMTSCEDSIIFDGEGDCSNLPPQVQFIFKKHRQALHSRPGYESDAFFSTVGTVHLFVYNSSGELVFDKTEKTDNLSSARELNLGNATDRCYLPLDIEPGTYKLVAWCGLDENDHNNAFSLNLENTKAPHYKECGVKFNDLTGHPVNLEKYESVYHGLVESVEIQIDPENPQIIPVELTKDNNDIAILIQHNNVSLSEGDYSVVYVDANGTMNFEDNSISKHDVLEYHPHSQSFLTSSTVYNGEDVEAGAMIAHISTSRLMNVNKDDARIEVRDKDGNTVFSIPFIKYVTGMQTFTNDHQYYLDCEDTYNCSFFLTGSSMNEDREYWVPYKIIINDWVIVPSQDTEITGE